MGTGCFFFLAAFRQFLLLNLFDYTFTEFNKKKINLLRPTQQQKKIKLIKSLQKSNKCAIAKKKKLFFDSIFPFNFNFYVYIYSLAFVLQLASQSTPGLLQTVINDILKQKIKI